MAPDHTTEPEEDPAQPSQASAPKRVFIVGFPRSGTTWMMWLLAQHKRVTAFQQSGLFHALQPLAEWWRLDHRFTRRSEQDEEGVYRMAGSTSVLEPWDLYDLLRPLVTHVFDKVTSGTPNAEVIVEQTPENAEFEGVVRGIFPNAYFLHVIRDPRAAYCSMRSAAGTWGRDFPSSPTTVARRWKEIVLKALSLRNEGERYMEVRYEDLVDDAAHELARVHEWLGLESTDEARARAAEACDIEKLRKRTKMPANFYRRGSAGGWRDEIPRSEWRILEYLIGDHMEEIGYPREHPRAWTKPFALRWAEVSGPVLGAMRRGMRRLLRRPRQTVRHLREYLESAQTRS